MPHDWFPDWSGQVCAVVASGQSATSANVEQLKGRCRVIVVNNNFRLAPWADVLYAADHFWWLNNRDAFGFAGIKVISDELWAKQLRLNFVKVAREADEGMAAHAIRTDIIGSGCNGGFQALNLAVRFGARRLLLVGFDLCGDHWHERHPEPLKNPSPRTLEKWRGYLDAAAPQFTKLGVEVVNCSEISALANYPKMDVGSALNKFHGVASNNALAPANRRHDG